MNRRQKITTVVVGLAMIYLLLVVVFGDNGLLELRRMHTACTELQCGE